MLPNGTLWVFNSAIVEKVSEFYNMKKLNFILIPITLILIAINLFVECHTGNDTGITAKRSGEVQEQVEQMADSIAGDVSKEGPAAWLHYFADEPQFFMASDGQLAFANYDSASVFINNTLVKTMPNIRLNWSNVRIDPIAENFAVMGAYFHEIITDSSGKQIDSEGYFTGTAEKTNTGWKLRNAHWSVNPVK
jgi:hypothetical protein